MVVILIGGGYLFDNENDTNSKSCEVINSLSDYKFYCFDGEPRIVMVSSGRFTDNLYFDYYDMNWERLSLVWDRPNSDIDHKRPECFDEMKSIVLKLCMNIPHVRVDLYVINNRPYFGELTFFDASGYCHFENPEWNMKLGSWIKLPKPIL